MSICDQQARRFLATIWLSLALGVGLGSWPAAADSAAPAAQTAPAPAPPGPLTTKDPAISLDDLELLLAPLSKDEVETEAKGWFDLLRAKEREITLAELSVHRKNREIALLEKQKAAAGQLAKATANAKATGGAGGAASEKVAEAQKALAKTVEATSSETAKEEKKAEAIAGATAKPAAASPATAPASDAKAGNVVAAAQKEAATAEQAKALAKAAPAAPATAPAAVVDASKKAEKLVEKTEEASAAKADAKVQLVDYSTQLTSERTALLDRLKLVLDNWELKGGDPKTYRLYVASIGGIKIDVSDRAATWARVSAWLTADEGGLRWARNLATFLAYILGSIVVARIVRGLLRRALGSGRLHSSQLLADFLVSSSGRIILAIGVLLGLSALEVNLAPLLAVIGAAGFVVAFALQGTLSNFASGLLIMVFKPFDIGDEVEAGGIKGKVVGVNIFSTTILTEEGLQNIVPNDNIWKNVIVNRTTGVSKNPGETASKPSAA
ncbi:mechanosensitive ion channel domain-containing protein [uncultured Rhodoblastus sp.]|uniref:mechanosensitive ion channel family protein n=1 Tax=uncultured Rhodoblastus sp. TaxID=543037 RepID=UPI0025E885FA|nr:mechanosensitive ion channel domain-containing protein [uncultured Rhodoblastus sp.]